MKPIRYIRWRIAWWRWFWSPNCPWGTPVYGKSREQLTAYNRAHDRYAAREPKREDYGL